MKSKGVFLAAILTVVLCISGNALAGIKRGRDQHKSISNTVAFGF